MSNLLPVPQETILQQKQQVQQVQKQQVQQVQKQQVQQVLKQHMQQVQKQLMQQMQPEALMTEQEKLPRAQRLKLKEQQEQQEQQEKLEQLEQREKLETLEQLLNGSSLEQKHIESAWNLGIEALYVLSANYCGKAYQHLDIQREMVLGQKLVAELVQALQEQEQGQELGQKVGKVVNKLIQDHTQDLAQKWGLNLAQAQEHAQARVLKLAQKLQAPNSQFEFWKLAEALKGKLDRLKQQGLEQELELELVQMLERAFVQELEQEREQKYQQENEFLKGFPNGDCAKFLKQLLQNSASEWHDAKLLPIKLSILTKATIYSLNEDTDAFAAAIQNTQQAPAQNVIDSSNQQPLDQAPNADAAVLVGLQADPNVV